METANNEIWDYLDKVYVITNKNSKQRERITKNLLDSGISNFELVDFEYSIYKKNKPDKYSFSDVFNCTLKCDNTCQNIKTNHLKILQDARKNNYEYIMILEDDAEFSGIDIDKMKRVKKWLLENNCDWDVFFLGYINSSLSNFTTSFVTRDIVNLISPLCAHCNIYNKRSINKLIHNLMDKMNHIDMLILEDKNIKKYGIFPIISYQVKKPAIYELVEHFFPINWNENYIFIEYVSLIFPIFIFLIILIIVWKITISYK